jgi:hypothetical protein
MNPALNAFTLYKFNLEHYIFLLILGLATLPLSFRHLDDDDYSFVFHNDDTSTLQHSCRKACRSSKPLMRSFFITPSQKHGQRVTTSKHVRAAGCPKRSQGIFFPSRHSPLATLHSTRFSSLTAQKCPVKDCRIKLAESTTHPCIHEPRT